MPKKIKNNLSVHIDQNSVNSEKDGVLSFNPPLVITDNTEQWNGTRYDIESMDISEYKGTVTANHSFFVEEIIGKVIGLKKEMNKVTIDGLKMAVKESSLARFVHDMLKAGFVTDFSIETLGPSPDDDGVYKNSILVGLSAVVMGNNKSATVNELAINAIKQSEHDGLDTTKLQSFLSENNVEGGEDMMFKTIKNTRKFAVKVTYTNSAGDETEITIEPGKTVEVPEDAAEGVQGQIDEAENPADTKTTDEPTVKDNNNADALEAALNKVAALAEKLEKLEQNAFDKKAQEPGFTKATNGSGVKSLSGRELYSEQINAAWDLLKKSDLKAGERLQEINELNLEGLKEMKRVDNSVTIADFGNFVISPELLTEIEGHRSDFAPFVNALDIRETNSLQMAYLVRNGDINMQEVEYCDDDADGNLKPISTYTADITTKNLHELAAVTPVCTSATRFLAADLLGDVAQGFRTDYQRKLAQLAIARMEQAVETTGNSITYDTSSDVDALKSMIDVWGTALEEVMNGTFIISQSTYAELVKRMVGAGANGPLAGVFTTGEVQQLLGRPYIVVPNELLPTLNTATTKSFTVEGSTVTVNHAAFYVDLSTYTGRTSGGLNYDLSTEAAYEENETVKSAFQRNELVLRGSFFRNGAIRDINKVVGLLAPGVS